ncbi:hypothetical protein FRC06_006524 [Ceratobasidium sp. 370]|nr:hypothetical protein FRC06_006524 [Ceratobasidium sp. 370]
MSRFIIALVLLFVTGLLTVTDVVSFSRPAFIFFSPALILSALIVIGHLYVYSVDFVRRIVALYDCHELVKFSSQTPDCKSYSDCYILALFQIGVEQLQQKLEDFVLGWCRILSDEVSSLISHVITAPLATARSRLQPYHDASPYSTSRIIVALACLVYLMFHFTLLALRYAVARLAGLALSLYSACTPTSIGLFLVLVSISAYSFRAYLARCQAIKHIESIYWTLRKMFSLEFDDYYDKDHDFVIDPAPKPEEEAVCANANYSADLDERQPYTQLADRSTDVAPPEVPSPVRIQDYTGVAAGFRPRSSLNLARIVYEGSLRMEQTNNQSQVKWAVKKSPMDYRFIPQTTHLSSRSGARRIDHRLESTLPGVASTPIDKISMSVGSMSLRDDKNPPSTTAGQLSHLGNTSSFPRQFTDSLAAPSTVSSPSHGSLPELVPDTYTSDSSSELNTSSDERYEVNGAVIRSSSKGSQTSSGRVRGFITRAKSKSSPLYAPKEVVEAQVVSGEDKVAAVLHRSQWKRKQKWWMTSKKQAKKAQATGIRSCSPVIEPMDTDAVGTEATRCGLEEELADAMVEPRGVPLPLAVDVPAATSEESTGMWGVKELPRRKATRPSRTCAPPSSGARTPAPMEFPTNPALASDSPDSDLPIKGLESSDRTPTAPGPPTPVVMTPKDLAASIDGKAKKTATICKARFAPVYTLLDEKRTVVTKGERIPPYTQYQVKDEKGTPLRVTGAKGMRV